MPISQKQIREVLSTYTNLTDAALDGASREVATLYGRAHAEGKREVTARQITGSVKGGQAVIRDPAGVLIQATPSVRLFIACCKVRDVLATVGSGKGSFGFATVSNPKLECPGLDKAFAPAASPEGEEVPVEHAEA